MNKTFKPLKKNIKDDVISKTRNGYPSFINKFENIADKRIRKFFRRFK